MNEYTIRANTNPPARVQAALVFLNQLTAKTGVIYACTDMRGLEVEQGQKLAPHEVEAQKAACNMLTQYFEGTLPLTHYDPQWSPPSAPLANPVEPPCCYVKTPDYASCPACIIWGSLNEKCDMCNGTGAIKLTIPGDKP